MANIEHLIVLMLENRSFDHMLGFLKSPEYDIEGLAGNEFNRDDSGEPIKVTSDARYSGDFDPDPGHDFSDVSLQMYGVDPPPDGQDPDMSGFVKAYSRKCGGNVAASQRIMKCFDPALLPVLTTLAKQFAVCDHWYSSIPGPTLPNRLFAHCGTSAGRLDMSPEFFTGLTTVYEVLDKNNVGGTIYTDGWTAAATFPYLLKFQDQFYGTMEQFFGDCEDDDLPPYCFVEPRYSSGFVNQTFRAQNDQHPDSDVFEGEKLIFRVYQAIRKNKKLWEKTVLVITYDEHGGLFDHVKPPAAESPDGRTSLNPKFDFKRLGLRVPTVVVSPYIDPGTISSDLYDHTSLIATAMDLFGVSREKMIAIKGDPKANPPRPDVINARVAKANNFVEKCVNRTIPRVDTVQFQAMNLPPTVPKPPALINDLQKEHVDLAAALEQKLPPGLRTGIDPTNITTDHQADDYVSKVFSALKQHPIS
jgi:phospholipase C